MRLLTTTALGLSALAVAALARRPRAPKTPQEPQNPRPAARVEKQPRVTWLVRVPSDTAADEPVSLCGNTAQLGSWNPLGVVLRRVAPDLYRVTMHVPQGTSMEYKITRGGWQAVEKCADGSERANRTLHVTGDTQVLLAVERWGDRA